jgi:hypothetical protein
LEEAVRGRFLLDYPRKGGVTLRKTLEDVERQSGIHDPLLNVTPIPEGFDSWFIRFMDIRRAESISYADLAAYQTVTGLRLSSVEIAAIFAMDHGASMAIAEILKEK